MTRKAMFNVVGAVVVPFLLHGCGDSPTSTTTPASTAAPTTNTSTMSPPATNTSTAPTSTAVPTPSPPSPSPATGVPELRVPQCSSDGSSVATTQGYFVTNVADDQPATWDAVTTVCWDADGITIVTNNTDYNIFQTCTECECNNFEQGDVAEAFLAPVSEADQVPQWYYELDVGAVTGAFWGGIVHNSLGTDDIYLSAYNCSAEPDPGAFASCKLNCTDGTVLPAVTVEQSDTWWARTMVIPWTMFAAEYTPAGNGGQPWPNWRGNFYRYSYPNKLANGTYSRNTSNGYELSGWSPTHDGSFHYPTAFGKLLFEHTAVTV